MGIDAKNCKTNSSISRGEKLNLNQKEKKKRNEREKKRSTVNLLE